VIWGCSVISALYRVEVSRKAARRIRNLPPKNLTSMAKRITQLGGNPRPVGTKKLSAKRGTYRIRAGDYRILYAVDDESRVVTVLDVDLRGAVYKKH
jgi:mRNA interferase RelE/StbE